MIDFAALPLELRAMVLGALDRKGRVLGRGLMDTPRNTLAYRCLLRLCERRARAVARLALRFERRAGASSETTVSEECLCTRA